jgi:hypothetical protein
MIETKLETITPELEGSEEFLGMDLRDYFASQALSAIIISYKGEDTESASATAYEYADAMMKARQT